MVEVLRGSHLGQGVEHHGAIADRSRLVDQALDQAPTEPAAVVIEPDEQSLHFATFAVERTERDAAGDAVGGAGVREQETAARRSVVAGKRRQLRGEALEAEIDAQPRLILDEELRAAAKSWSQEA